MSARELLVDTPEWEVDLLAGERTRMIREAEKRQQGG